jgi:hypothetical protein
MATAELKTAFSQLEVTVNGTVQLRLAKQIVVNGSILSQEWHRTAFPPGGDVDARVALVNDHLGKMGYGPISSEDTARIKSLIAAAHTPDIVTAYQEQVAAEQAARQAQQQEQQGDEETP